MTSLVSPIELANNLDSLTAEAASRRQVLKKWRGKIRGEESTLKSQLATFTSCSPGRLAPVYSLASKLDPNGSSLLAEITEAAKEMNELRDAVDLSKERIFSLERQLSRERDRRNNLRTLGFWLLILVVGYFILKDAGDETETNRINDELAKERSTVNALELRLTEARTRALASLEKLAADAEVFFTKKLNEDTQQWNAVWERCLHSFGGIGRKRHGNRTTSKCRIGCHILSQDLWWSGPRKGLHFGCHLLHRF